MALSRSCFMSQNEAKFTFLSSAKLTVVYIEQENVCLNFLKMNSTETVFTALFGIKKINSRFALALRDVDQLTPKGYCR